jgi:hypothetical protein
MAADQSSRARVAREPSAPYIRPKESDFPLSDAENYYVASQHKVE